MADEPLRVIDILDWFTIVETALTWYIDDREACRRPENRSEWEVHAVAAENAAQVIEHLDSLVNTVIAAINVTSECMHAFSDMTVGDAWTCREANSLGALLAACGHRRSAEWFLDSHAIEDPDEDGVHIDPTHLERKSRQLRFR